MNILINYLKDNPDVWGYKINIHEKQSAELFFVKGKLETVRRTDTCDKEVTVYTSCDGCVGDAQFFVYPSTTPLQIQQSIADAVAKAKLISNPEYSLPSQESGSFQVESNFADYAPMSLAGSIADAVFSACTVENAALNSVEVFVNRHTDRVMNSNGLDKTQVHYDAMIETIPTFNGAKQSVELYHQYNFGAFDPEQIQQEVRQKLKEVQGRYEAVTPTQALDCPVLLPIQELAQLYWNIARDLNYATVYSHSNLYKKGDSIQQNPTGDFLDIVMCGQIPGSVRSVMFDGDGLSMTSVDLITQGKAVNYYGGNRYGQYLGETPTGNMQCLKAKPGTLADSQLAQLEYLEVVSMSGLQVDAYNDYIGGEIRLAYLQKDGKAEPITGISISGKLSVVLNSLKLSEKSGIYNGYYGPSFALLKDMKIY